MTESLARSPTLAPVTSSSGSRAARRHTGGVAETGLWVVVVAWTAVGAVVVARPSGISWHFFDEGARMLLRTAGLHLYAADPLLQIGPLSLLVAGALDVVTVGHALGGAQVLMTLALPAGLALLGSIVPQRHRRLRLLLAGLLAAPTWVVLAVRWAHLDDILAILLLTITVAAVRSPRGRPVLAGLAVAAAVAAKPWAVIGLPLLLVLPTGRLRAGVAVATGMAVAWLPFLVADPGTVGALRPAVGINDSSTLWLVGIRDAVVPGWVRTAQLLGGPLAALVVVLRGRWPAALLAGIAVRLLLDPQDIAYYAGSAVLAAVVADLFGHRSRIPWLALLTSVALWQPFVPDFTRRFGSSTGLALWWFQHPGAVAVVHTVWAVAVVAWGIIGRRPPSGAAGQDALRVSVAPTAGRPG